MFVFELNCRIYLARPRRAAPQKVARLDDEGAEDAEERGRQVGDRQAEDQAGEQTVPELGPPAAAKFVNEMRFQCSFYEPAVALQSLWIIIGRPFVVCLNHLMDAFTGQRSIES